MLNIQIDSGIWCDTNSEFEKKKKHNTAKKKVVAVATIGLPILFSLYLYNYKGVYKFPFKLVMGDDTRKKMGKKQKKNKKK